MRKFILLIVTLLFFSVIIVTSNIYAANLSINGKKINFNVSPNVITKTTLIPLNQLKEKVSLEIINITNKKLFIYYKNNHAYVYVGKNKIKTKKKTINLQQVPLEVNEHILVPLELITDILKIKINKDKFQLKRPDSIKSKELKITVLPEKKNFYKKEDKIRIKLLLKNKSNEPKILKFSSSQIYDIIIKDKNNNVVYKWSEGKFFSQAFKEIKINAGENLSYKTSIKIADLSPGVYYLYAIIKSKKELITKNVEITIKN